MTIKMEFSFNEESLAEARSWNFAAGDSNHCFAPEGCIKIFVNGKLVKSWEQICVIDHVMQLRCCTNKLQPGQTFELMFMDGSSARIRLTRKTSKIIEVSDRDSVTFDFEGFSRAINWLGLELHNALRQVLPQAIVGEGNVVTLGLIGEWPY